MNNIMEGKSLSEEIHRWMTQEMKFVPMGRHASTSLPTPQDLSQITRGPLMTDIWKFVVSYVHSAQTVKKVKGNLALKRRTDSSYKVKYKGDKKYDETLQGLLETKTKLLQEKKSLEGDVHHLTNEVSRLEQEICATEEEFDEKSSTINSLRCKCALLSHYSMQNQNLIQHYKEYASRMERQLKNVVEKAKKGTENEEYFSRKKSSTDEDHYTNSSGLETKCSREVRKTCSQLANFLLQVLEGKFGTDRNLIGQKKQIVWEDVESVLKEFSVQQIYDALIVNIIDATQIVREMSAQLDIRKDAEKLRFRFEKSGELRDLASSPSVLSSVDQLLQENYFHQCQRFVETEKYKNETWKLDQKFEDLSQQIDSKLHSMFPKREDVKLVRAYIDDKILFEGKRAALHGAHEETTELRELVIQSQQQHEILMAKYRKIHDFQATADRKQQLIRVLVKQNADAKSRLDTQKKKILEYCQRLLTVHKMEVRTLKTGLQGSIATEVTKFTSLHLPYLMYTESNDSALKVAVMDLSIGQLTDPDSIAARPALQKVLDIINFPKFQAPELLLPQCMDLKLSTENLWSRAGKLQFDMEDSDILDKLKDLCSAVEDQDEKLLKKLLPFLKSRIDKSEKVLRQCQRVTDRVQEWWDQPGQDAVHWEKVDNNELQHWKKRWNVLVTKIRQHEVKT